MAENSAIEWTDHTFNPWIGCTKVSPGCDHCYAEHLMDTRMHKVRWGAGQLRVRTSDAYWREPLRWNAKAEREGRRYRVFCASLADVFDNEVPDAWRADLFALIDKTPHLDWLLLTKRIGNAKSMLDEVSKALALRETGAPWPPRPNVWLGATVVNQAEADRDIPKLLATPAATRFLSLEPLLGPVDLMPHLDLGPTNIDWVIVGGESGGSQARTLHPDWVRALRDQCGIHSVPFFFKQWGEYEYRPVALDSCPHICAIDAAGRDWALSIKDGKISHLGPDAGMWTLDRDHLPIAGLVEWTRVGKKAAGRLLDGRTWDEVPA